MTASLDGYVSKNNLVTISKDEVVDFTLDAAAPIDGIVVDERGQPVEGALLEADGHAPPFADAFGIETNAEGRFHFGATPAGRYLLTVEADGYAPAHVQVVAPSSSVRVVLQRGAPFKGRVLEADGSPVKGVRVSADHDEGTTAQLDPEAVTDELGRFAIPHLAPGPYTVHAEREGRKLLTAVTLPASGELVKDLQFPPARRISGRVVDDDGRPLSKAIVKASPSGGVKPAAKSTGRATTNANGDFIVEDLFEGEYLLEAEAPHHELTLASVRARTGDTNVKLVLAKSSVVTGKVVSVSGEPVTSFELNGDELSPEDGTFTYPMLRVNGSWLAVRAEGFASRYIYLPALKGEKALGDIVLDRGRELTGTVTNAVNGQPVAGARVQAAVFREEGGRRSSYIDGLNSTVTDGAGAFRIGNLGTDAVKLSIRHPNFLDAMVDATPGAVVKLQPAATVEVVFETSSGHPVTGSVRTMAMDPAASGLPRMCDLMAGRCTLGGVAPGKYRLFYFGPSGGRIVPTEIDVEAGSHQRVALKFASP